MCKTPKLPGYGLIIIDVVYVILLIIMFYYLIDLAIFHIKLIYRGISTYQYIITQQQQQQQKQQQQPPPPAEEPKQITSLEEGKDNNKNDSKVENEIQLTIIGGNNNNNNNKYHSPPPKKLQEEEQQKVSFSSSSSISASASPIPLQNITPTQPPLHPQNQHSPPQQQQFSSPEEVYKSKDFTVTKMSNDGNIRAARPSNVEIDFENKTENSGGVGGGDLDIVAHKITVASKEAAIPETSDSDK